MEDAPDTTPEAREATERKRLAGVAQMFGGTVPETIADQPQPEPRRTGSGKPAAVVCDQTNEVFASISALAKSLQLNYARVYEAIQRGSELNGMTYTLVAPPKASSETPRKPISKPVRAPRAVPTPAADESRESDTAVVVEEESSSSPPSKLSGEYKGFVRIAFIEIEDASSETVRAVLDQFASIFKR